MHRRGQENFKFGTVKVSKLRPTNNDAGSHAVKLRVDHAVVVNTGSRPWRAPRLARMENAI